MFNMNQVQENLFLKSLCDKIVEGDTDAVLPIWEALWENGYHSFTRNVMARVCENGFTDLLQFMMEHDYVFDKLAIYISAFSGNIHSLELLFAYQEFQNVNKQHLRTQLVEKELNQVIEYLENIDFF
jgi:hypothetical protein